MYYAREQAILKTSLDRCIFFCCSMESKSPLWRLYPRLAALLCN